MEEQEVVSNFVSLPVLCTRGIVIFPRNEMPIEVGRAKSLTAIRNSHDSFGDLIIVVSQTNPEDFDPDVSKIYRFGTLAKIKTIKNNSDGSQKVTLIAESRVKINNLAFDNGSLFAKCEVMEDVIGDKNEELALIRFLATSIETLATENPKVLPSNVVNQLSKGVSAVIFADLLAQYLQNSLESKQALLEEVDVNKRLTLLVSGLEEERKVNEIENKINQKVRERIDDSQKEYLLREKMRAIREELGDTPDKDDDSDSIRENVNKNPYPKNIKEKILDELKRYDMMQPSSPEASMIRNYIDWMLDTPWYQTTVDNDNLSDVEKILNDDHYGLDKIKERILEYLAVKKLTSSLKAPIICFSGPPGTGKTSLAISIAHALNRKFVKCSLGGVKDEAEIRGHRRTYLGSMPGRIIQGMKKAGVINPVFLLDEIDKLGSDYKGDPSSALLEVLDPEQNKAFSDHYLEETYDLSNVLFIATANYLENVPAPLRDRLEIIELSSYTEQEKLMIAKNHLIKKQVEQNGLSIKKIEFLDESIMYIIRNYTREAGVRNLERQIGAICRKVAVRILKEGKNRKESISIAKVKEYLGKELFDYTRKEKKDQIGVVMGLAYTQYGGDILPVEVTHFEGKGRVTITGNLGDVMKESANIALGYVRSNAAKYNIDSKIFETNDIHIHFPEGAVPKDGPSAGVTMTTAIVSALSNMPAKADVAMTGEITLRGNVLPIGGLKEKSISAHRSGIKTIYIPRENERDIDDIPESVRKDLSIVLIDHVEQIIEKVLVVQEKEIA